MKDYGKAAKQVFDYFGLPSLAVGVYDRGEIAYYFYGVDDGKAGNAVTKSGNENEKCAEQKSCVPDEKTRYMIGSASKCYIATAVCRLASEGKIDLDVPVKRYLPDLMFYNEEMTEKITIRMILSHQTGLPRHDVSWVNHTEGTLCDTVHNIRYLQPAFRIGERFYYQNHMFALASRLVEVVSGMSWQDYVCETILKPLGMERTLTDTSFFGRPGMGCAAPYAKVGGKNVPWMIWKSDNMGCAASMTSTVEDELKWMVANLKGGIFDGKMIFDSWANQQLHTPQMPIREYEMYGYPMERIDISDASYGFGWFLETQSGERVIHHGGTVGGFRSECGYLPDRDVAFVVFSNLDGTQAVNAMQRMIADIACGNDPRKWCRMYDEAATEAKKRSLKAVEPLLAAAGEEFCDPSCEGTYVHPAYGKIRVTGAEDHTTRIWFLGQPLKMKRVNGETAKELLLIDAVALANIAAPCRFIRQNNLPDGPVVGFAAMLEPEIKDFIVFERETE